MGHNADAVTFVRRSIRKFHTLRKSYTLMTLIQSVRARTNARSRMVAAVYLSGFLSAVGLSLFPGSGALFTEQYGYLTDSQFGTLFAPQLIAASMASLLLAQLARRFGMKRVFIGGMLLVSLSSLLYFGFSRVVLADADLGFAVLIVANIVGGAGFGTIVAALNTYGYDLFPKHPAAAVTGVHALTGMGLALGPVLVAAFAQAGIWWGAGLVAAGAVLLLALFAMRLPLRLSYESQSPAPSSAKAGGGAAPVQGAFPLSIWLFTMVAFLYGACEGTFGNWTTVYLQREAGFLDADAGIGLSVFWGTITLGRVLFALVATQVNARVLHVIAPVFIAAAFVVLPLVEGYWGTLLVIMGAAAASSFYFPYSVSLATDLAPQRAAAVSGLMMMGVQLGVGFATFVTGFINPVIGMGTAFQLTAGYAVIMTAVAAYLYSARADIKAAPVATT